MFQVVREDIPDVSTPTLVAWHDNVFVCLRTALLVDGPPHQTHHLEASLVLNVVQLCL